MNGQLSAAILNSATLRPPLAWAVKGLCSTERSNNEKVRALSKSAGSIRDRVRLSSPVHGPVGHADDVIPEFLSRTAFQIELTERTGPYSRLVHTVLRSQ